MLPLLNHLHAATSQTSALRVQLADMAVVVCLGYHLGILLCVGFSFGVQLHGALLHGSCWMGFGVFSPEHCSCQTLYWYSVGVFVFRLTCWIASIGLLHVFLSLLLGQTHCSSQFHIAHWCFGAQQHQLAHLS